MNDMCFQFGVKALPREEIQNKKVIEIGSYDHNGTLRKYFESLGPTSYLGADILEGPGVDEVCGIDDLVSRYGKDSFDIVISTEVMEHVRYWQSAISNLKNIVRPGGLLVLTTRSIGFPYHAYPHDFWRYEIEDMQVIFSDFEILLLESDASEPGVFLKVRKPAVFVEKNLENYPLYSMLARNRAVRVGALTEAWFNAKEVLRKVLRPIMPQPMLKFLKKLFPR